MKFAKFLQHHETLTGPGNEPYLVAVSVLVMFMIATYLLMQRGSVWHVASGIVVAVVAAIYALTMAGLMSVEGGPLADFVSRALAMLGLA